MIKIRYINKYLKLMKSKLIYKTILIISKALKISIKFIWMLKKTWIPINPLQIINYIMTNPTIIWWANKNLKKILYRKPKMQIYLIIKKK
jgi:hypothetical protein